MNGNDNNTRNTYFTPTSEAQAGTTYYTKSSEAKKKRGMYNNRTTHANGRSLLDTTVAASKAPSPWGDSFEAYCRGKRPPANLSGLAPGQWLDDEIIDFCLDFIVSKVESKVCINEV